MEQMILRLPKVKAITGLSRSTIYLRMSEGAFPKHISLGSRAVGWLKSEVALPQALNPGVETICRLVGNPGQLSSPGHLI